MNQWRAVRYPRLHPARGRQVEHFRELTVQPIEITAQDTLLDQHWGTGRDLPRGGNCPDYTDAIYEWAAACRRGRRYLCYFNLPDGGVELTLDQTPASLARLAAGVAEACLGRRRDQAVGPTARRRLVPRSDAARLESVLGGTTPRDGRTDCSDPRPGSGGRTCRPAAAGRPGRPSSLAVPST